MEVISDNNLLTTAKRVAIFGLSGNPPTYTRGHAGVVQHFVNSGLFDELWILPVYIHAFQTKRSLETYEHRMAMCELNFEGEMSETCRVLVKAYERDVYNNIYNDTKEACSSPGSTATPSRVGTIDVIRWVKQRMPTDTTIGLILGTDTYQDLMTGKWKSAEE